MKHTITEAPANEPVTLAEMRAHLGITQATDKSRDSIITARIASARAWAEDYTRRAFISQTWTAYDEDFPYSDDNRIDLKAPLSEISSISYLDADGVRQTLATSAYLVDTVDHCVVPAYGESWPSVRSQRNSVQVEYICGYGDAADVPEPVKDAIRFIVGQWEVFQSSMEGVMRPFTIPNAAKQLLDNYIDLREAF